MESADPADHLRDMHQKARLRRVQIRLRADWIEERQRELWKRLDLLEAQMKAPPEAASPAAPRDVRLTRASGER